MPRCSGAPAGIAQRLLDRQGGADGAPRMVLVGDGRAEQRHEAVAHELGDRSLVAVDRLQHQLEAAPDQGVRLFGIEALGERVEPTTSANSTVTCLRSPSSAERGRRIFSARCRGVYAWGRRPSRPLSAAGRSARTDLRTACKSARSVGSTVHRPGRLWVTLPRSPCRTSPRQGSPHRRSGSSSIDPCQQDGRADGPSIRPLGGGVRRLAVARGRFEAGT